MLEVVRTIGQALLIGFLVGAQREAALGELHPGMRDFLLIALVGAISGLLHQPWAAIATLICITVLLAVFHFQVAERKGITTEMAAIATFWFGYLTTTPHANLAIGMTIVVVAFLEAKQSLHKFVRDTINVTEFNDSLRFLALIFVIYPILPVGRFGPYQFFAPRQVWLFVILVSSISYVGYFLTKFLGADKGLALTSLMGGLASTTAATASFAKNYHDDPKNVASYWQATLFANAMLSPRVLLVLYAVNADLARATAAPLLAMCGVGLLLGWIVSLRRGAPSTPDQAVQMGNPFRLWPALKFGALFTAIVFIGQAAAHLMGERSTYWTSAIGGLVDVSAVAVTLSDLLQNGHVPVRMGVNGVLLGWATNALLKNIIAATSGSPAFGWRVAVGFMAMFGAGLLALAL